MFLSDLDRHHVTQFIRWRDRSNCTRAQCFLKNNSPVECRYGNVAER